MKTIAELRKEKLTTRATNPERAALITMLIARAESFAKNQMREATDEDIKVAALGMKKEVEGDLLTLQEAKVKNPLTDIATAEAGYLKERELLMEFVPKLLGEDAIRVWLKKFSDDFFVKANYGAIMKEAKTVENMDCGILAQILKEKIK